MMHNLLFCHLCIGWSLGLFDHPSQRLVLIPQNVDLFYHPVSRIFDKGLGVILDNFHLCLEGLVLELYLFEIAKGTINVILIQIALRYKSDISTVLRRVQIHHGSIRN